MWRIGQLARMAGVSDRTLRHYDRIGLLRPAAVDPASGYRWYGAAELTRLERIRGLRRLGLPLRRIADLVDAPDAQLRAALAETVDDLRRDMAAMATAVAAAEDRLAVETSILPQETDVAARRLRVHYLDVAHPSELSAWCSSPTTLVTWLQERPADGFVAAVATGGGGETLTLPARSVVRAVVPPTRGVVHAGQELFDWVRRHDLVVAGPTVEEHLVDADGDTATVLEIPVRPAGPGPRR
ncbi:MerR family transcriptional regulator [Saccharothrix stipae]